MPDTFLCEACGAAFSLPPSVRQKYPDWRPKTCMDCRQRPAASTAGDLATAQPPAPRGRSVTSTQVLPVAAVLKRFSGGPATGVFTDGSCSGNPGPGGWGAVHVRDGAIVAEQHGADPQTTNNRMEFTAAIAGLEMLPPDARIDLYTDSMLVVNTLTKWAAGWEARGWKRKEGAVKNLDLVQRAFALARARPGVRIQWIRAHDGSRWNEYADALSTAYLRAEV